MHMEETRLQLQINEQTGEWIRNEWNMKDQNLYSYFISWVILIKSLAQFDTFNSNEARCVCVFVRRLFFFFLISVIRHSLRWRRRKKQCGLL